MDTQSDCQQFKQWFKNLFCCMKPQVSEDEDPEGMNYSKFNDMSDASILKRFPRLFFKNKYAPVKQNEQPSELVRHLIADNHSPWLENYKEANDEYEMDSMLRDQLEQQSQVQNQLILDTDL